MSRLLKFWKFCSASAVMGAMIIALPFDRTRATELVMFERAGCVWCEAFDRDVAPIYGKTEEGLRAPLRRLNIMQSQPADLAFVDVERLTPVFVLVDGGREIGRIRGYPGDDHFWGLLGVLMKQLDASTQAAQRVRLNEESHFID